MIGRLIEMFTGEASRGGDRHPDALQVAVAALLIEAARMDDGFDGAEQAMIRDLLARRFDLSPAETERLVRAAGDAQDRSVGMYRHIRRITDGYDADERIELVEMLWEVAYADGTLDPQEDALVRRIAGLVHVSDQERGAARKRVLARRGQAA